MTDISQHESICIAATRIPQCIEIVALAEATVQQIQINNIGGILVKIDADPNGFITDMSNIKTSKRGDIEYQESDLAGFTIVWEKKNDSNNNTV